MCRPCPFQPVKLEDTVTPCSVVMSTRLVEPDFIGGLTLIRNCSVSVGLTTPGSNASLVIPCTTQVLGFREPSVYGIQLTTRLSPLSVYSTTTSMCSNAAHLVAPSLLRSTSRSAPFLTTPVMLGLVRAWSPARDSISFQTWPISSTEW